MPRFSPNKLSGNQSHFKTKLVPDPLAEIQQEKKVLLWEYARTGGGYHPARVNRIHMTGIPHPWMNDTLEWRKKNEHQLDNPPFTLAGLVGTCFPIGLAR